MGLEQVNGQYTEGAKVQARAALIMEQLKDAHGDVIRTSGSTENQIKRMNAAFEELRVMVGTKLLPVITPLIEKIASALNWFTQLPVPVQNTTIAVVAIAAALGPVILGLGGIVSGIGAALPVLAALAAVITGTAQIGRTLCRGRGG